MNILIICLSDSVHVAKWIRVISARGWDIHVFPSHHVAPHPDLRDITFHMPAPCDVPMSSINPSVRVRSLVSRPLDRARRFAKRPVERARLLAHLIEQLQPDIIHSMEFQHACYLTLEARRLMAGQFPPWIVSNWGSDIYLFGRLAGHRERIAEVLATCDYYTCECERDVALARQHGLRGEVLPVTPVGGGYDLDALRAYRALGPTSARRTITLKGYQGWAGRATVGLRAIELCGRRLAGYRLALYLATPEVVTMAEIICEEAGLELEVVSRLPGTAPYEEILRMQGRSRVSIGLSISDAISTSFLETIMMGAFPIQSHTGCANEWIEDGVSGILVHPEDPDAIAAALLRAVEEDELVDRAADLNAETARQRLAMHVIQPRAVAMYEHVAARGAPRRAAGGG